MTDTEKQLAILYKEVFNTVSGQLVIEDLRRVFNFDLSIVPRDNNGRIDELEVMRNEGKRSVILHILKTVAKDLDKPESQTETEIRYI
jgi:hypothetical protein